MAATNLEFVEEQLNPAIREVLKLCDSYQIPVFIAIGISQEDGKIDIQAESNCAPLTAHAILPEMIQLQTRDTRFAEFVNVVNGFKTLMPSKPGDFNVDDYDISDNIETSSTDTT